MAESKFTTIKNKIEAEIDAANEVTGKEDETLHDAAETLVEGYHTGGENKLNQLLAKTLVELTTEDFAGVTQIGKYQFDGQSKLSGTLTLPEGITAVQEGGFQSCSKIEYLILPDSLTTLGSLSFSHPSSLKSVQFGNGLKSIDSSCFYENSKITELVLPASLKSVSGYGLGALHALKTVTFHGTPTSLANSTFSYDQNLTQINVPWAEGEVANAPWGATNATITYNYTPEGGNA